MAWNFSPIPVLTPQRLEQQLEELDITNKEAAYFAGVSDATLYRWLQGVSPVPASVIRMFDLHIFLKNGAGMIKVVWATPESEEAHGGAQEGS